jgi:putative transposase
VKTIADTLGVARSNLAVQAAAEPTRRRRGRPAQPEAELVAEIKALIAGQPTYGYRRIHALLLRKRWEEGSAAVNVKRVYRVMKTHGLLLERHTGSSAERRHDGRVAVDLPDTRWCSDGFEIGCDNGEKVRIAFTLRLLRSGGDLLGGNHRRHQQLRYPRPDGRERRTAVRAGRQTAQADRVAVGQRLALHRRGNACPGPRYRPGAVYDTHSEPSVERHGRSLRQTDQAGLRAGQREARRGQRVAPARFLVRALQHRAPHKALGYRSPRQFRKSMVEKTTESAVGAMRRPDDGTTATEAVGSRPKPPQAGARSASLDVTAAMDHL